MRSGRAVAQPFHAFRMEPIDPFGHDLGRYVELARGRSLALAAFGYTAHHRLSTFGRQRRILVAVHLVSPWNTEASQPQLPRFRPDGQPPERPHLGATTLTVTPWAGFVIEAVLAFFLVTVVLSTAVAGRAGNLAPLAIGMTLTLNIIMGG